MSFILQPWHLMFFVFAGWVNRQQQDVIEYLRTENQVLKKKLGKKRILLNDDQRRRLGVKGEILGRNLLAEFSTLFTLDTILRWHCELVANKWDFSDRKKKQVGRPRIRQGIVDLTVKFAKENPTWGFDRIQGELAKVGYPISDTTVGNILKSHGIEPAPSRKRTGSWATFLKPAIVGIVVFSLAIAPLGVASAFPCTVVLPIAAIMIWNNGSVEPHNRPA